MEYKDLIVPKGFDNQKDSLRCPHCKEGKTVYHISHRKVRAGWTEGYICLDCTATWRSV